MHLLELTSTGSDGFVANGAWKAAQTDAGVLCSHCGAIQPGMLEKLQTIVVDNKRPLKPHIGTVGGLRPCEAMSTKLLEAIGRERIEPLKLKRLKANRVKILDQPTDGLPTDSEELIAELERRGALK